MGLYLYGPVYCVPAVGPSTTLVTTPTFDWGPAQNLREQEIAQKLGSGGVWGETASPKHLQDTIQSIWVAGFPQILVLGSIRKQNHVFQGFPGAMPTFWLGWFG